jgi:hypothetical protein
MKQQKEEHYTSIEEDAVILEYATPNDGIDIVNYDFNGGIRVKTNRIFVNRDEAPPFTSRSANPTPGAAMAATSNKRSASKVSCIII